MIRWFPERAVINSRSTGLVSHRGEVDLPRFREAELGDRLAITLRNIHVPDNVLVQLEKSLLTAYFLYLKQEPAEKAKFAQNGAFEQRD